MILDETTANFDYKERVRFRILISSFSENKIVLISTHIISDDIMVMKDGKIIHEEEPEEILK